MDLPIPSSSVIAFILTFGVGYVILIWAYSDARRLYDWYSLDTFDKTLQTFVVGGIVTFFSLIVSNAPFSFTDDLFSTELFLGWLQRNVGAMFIAESILIVLTQYLIRIHLVRAFENANAYIS